MKAARHIQSNYLKTTVSIRTIYECSLERAFKTPILTDISKIHTGFLIVPKVTHCTSDQLWGRPGYSKNVIAARSFTQKGGWVSTDKVLERIENKYWKIEVANFKSWMLGYSKFIGEWRTTELETNKIQVDYTYSLYSENVLLYPINWTFTNTIWRIYMFRVLKNIRKMIENREPYLYD